VTLRTVNAGLNIDHYSKTRVVLYVAVLPVAQSRSIRESSRCVTQYPVYRGMHFSEARNVPSIGYEETKACKGSSLVWNIPFIGIARFHPDINAWPEAHVEKTNYRKQ